MCRADSGACVRIVAPVKWNQDLELISPPVEIQNFLLCRLLCLHNPMEWPWFLWGRVPKGIRNGPFPGELCLSLSAQEDDKPTLFSLTSNSNLTFHFYLIPCCAVLAFRFLLNCSQGCTEELHSKSQLCLGGQRLPAALQISAWRLHEISTGITIPLAVG